jgi:hypothetical protein
LTLRSNRLFGWRDGAGRRMLSMFRLGGGAGGPSAICAFCRDSNEAPLTDARRGLRIS